MHVCPVTTSLSVEMGTKVVLYCPCIPLTRVLITTWQIRFRNKPSCKIAHNRETNQTIKTSCVDRRITWASRPDQSPHLQIYATAITHDGYFRCQMAAYHGNFRRGYHLQVLGKERLGTPESPGSTLLIILYAKLSLLVVILVIVGFAFSQRINGCSFKAFGPRQHHPRHDTFEKDSATDFPHILCNGKLQHHLQDIENQGAAQDVSSKKLQ
ncbi:cell surface glycoprotein CD200 receptor 1-like [Urocitellus parryii]